MTARSTACFIAVRNVPQSPPSSGVGFEAVESDEYEPPVDQTARVIARMDDVRGIQLIIGMASIVGRLGLGRSPDGWGPSAERLLNHSASPVTTPFENVAQ